jgi:hypothetical protein
MCQCWILPLLLKVQQKAKILIIKKQILILGRLWIICSLLVVMNRITKRDNLVSYSVLYQNPTTRGLVDILDHFWCWDKSRATRTHLTHHDRDLGEATTFPHIVFSTLLCRTYIQMSFFSGTPKSPKVVPICTLAILGNKRDRVWQLWAS